MKRKVLLVGYNGANNTGAEARLLSIVQDLRDTFGTDVAMTVPTLNETNTRRYLPEAEDLRIVRMPPLFYRPLRRLVREHDVVMLIEGSTYMDTWTSFLLWYFLHAIRCAADAGKPCLSYAVDAGDASAANVKRIRRVASRSELIITRTEHAARRLREWGVTAPVTTTADTAFTFQPRPDAGNALRRLWPEARRGVIGISVVNFHLWPVSMRLFGRRRDCYRWPYYFASSPERTRGAQDLAHGFAALADTLSAATGRCIAFVCMEQVDEPLAHAAHAAMGRKNDARVFAAGNLDASDITGILRSLDLLITSRYHAAVLSLAAQVPQIAIGHDRRLSGLYRDLGIYESAYFRPSSPELWPRVDQRARDLLRNPGLQTPLLRAGHESQLHLARGNRRLLESFFAQTLRPSVRPAGERQETEMITV